MTILQLSHMPGTLKHEEKHPITFSVAKECRIRPPSELKPLVCEMLLRFLEIC